jgi:hypothetical protein
MLPPLKTVKAGLHDATEALALELARPGTPTPDWDGVQWRLASAAAAAHGVPAMLHGRCRWRYEPWQRFLRDQHAHVLSRQRRIAATLSRIDAGARDAGIAAVALKGAALHAIGLYAPGERPMADIDLLVAEATPTARPRCCRRWATWSPTRSGSIACSNPPPASRCPASASTATRR